MPSQLQLVNDSVVETVAGTIAYKNIPIPNSEGAREVHLVRAELDVPHAVAGASAADKTIKGGLQLGRAIPTDVVLSEGGMIYTRESVRASDGTNMPTLYMKGPEEIMGRYEIQRDPQNQGYYITICVKSYAGAAVQTVTVSAVLEIVR
jgi:hypothetical protein